MDRTSQPSENVTSHYLNSNDSADLNATAVVIADPPMPVYAQAIIIIMYSTISVLAVGGNVLVIYTVFAYQRMRTVTNYMIVNLACSDILTAVLCIPFTYIANLVLHFWPFGAIMCPLVTYAQAVVVFVSAFTLVAISLDRCRAILFPLKPRLTTCQVFIILAVIWIFSLAVPLPIAIVSRLELKRDHYDPSIMRIVCSEEWPEDVDSSIFTLFVMILQYFLPLLVLLFTYSTIGVIIWVKKPPGEAENNRDQRMAASKRKMVKMMITVVVVYAVCWLPLHTIHMVGDSHPTMWYYRHIQTVWIACHWLAMSNSCYNPIVYCWMNSRFRNGFRSALRCCPCIKFNHEESEQHKMTRLHTYVSTMRTSISDRNVTTCHSPYSARINSNLISNASKDKASNTLMCPLPNNTNGCMNGKYNRYGGDVVYRPDDLTYAAEKTPLTMDSD